MCWGVSESEEDEMDGKREESNEENKEEGE